MTSSFTCFPRARALSGFPTGDGPRVLPERVVPSGVVAKGVAKIDQKRWLRVPLRHRIESMEWEDLLPYGEDGTVQPTTRVVTCLLYTSDAADDLLCVD